jgi:hypothetical protein
MNKITNPTFGSDPEFGFINIVTGEAVSGEGNIGGDKKEPVDIGMGCGKQEDGVMAEGTIPPVTTRQAFIDSIMYCRNHFDKLIKEKDKNYQCVSISSLKYSEKDLNTEQAMTFGCDPSFCIYTKNVSARPEPEEVGNLRSAGFHIHVGTKENLSIEEIEHFIFLMDVCCGLPSVFLDKDQDRKALYGNAGDFRFKLNPDLTLMEYRTLGGNNHATEDLIGFYFDQTEKAIEMFNNFDNFKELSEKYYFEVQKAIDTSDENLATQLLNLFKIDISFLQLKNQKVSSYV